MLNPASYQHVHQMAPYGRQLHNPGHSAWTQQQYYLPQFFVSQAAQYQVGTRLRSLHEQTEPPYALTDNHAYSVSQPGLSVVDMRSSLQQFPIGYDAPGSYADLAQYARSNPEPVAVPRHPRGPPQKPKQSGHALWVGNLHPATSIANLKDHFSRDATSEIQSLFFISKTNCAFVNYRSELACLAALDRFNGSRLHGARLVCRLKRDSTSTSDTSAIAASLKLALTSSVVLEAEGPKHDVAVGKPSGPVIVDSAPVAPSPMKTQTKSSNLVAPKVPEMFFILKSLTLQDLEESVRNGMWTTQSHNEAILNQAFNAADNVYLIFSANRSGEYFGFARMVSPIVREAVPAGSALDIQPPVPSDGPRSIPTPATETAPRGRVVDDLARGTIFWEAELSDEESALPNTELEEGSGGQDLGHAFQIEWISTARLPFYRTRGLRNPWNANKEVKIARDGTGLEPSIGRRLVQMFHVPAQTCAPPNSLQLAGSPSQMA